MSRRSIFPHLFPSSKLQEPVVPVKQSFADVAEVPKLLHHFSFIFGAAQLQHLPLLLLLFLRACFLHKLHTYSIWFPESVMFENSPRVGEFERLRCRLNLTHVTSLTGTHGASKPHMGFQWQQVKGFLLNLPLTDGVG